MPRVLATEEVEAVGIQGQPGQHSISYFKNTKQQIKKEVLVYFIKDDMNTNCRTMSKREVLCLELILSSMPGRH
jgi:hypothetical protein